MNEIRCLNLLIDVFKCWLCLAMVNIEVIVELRLLLIFAVLTVPGYIVASSMKRCEENASADCAESSSSA